MHINIIPNTTMTSGALTHRAAVRTRKKIYHENVDRYPLQICPAAILINCISDLCQKHILK